ncbi:hypothetical protein [uncultured Gimesia sp.]|uniref:hypothetical protein n=1 Tax=uncultured Gimesia sp. TaxID=1678688 RepID=UPI0026145EDC|nr:hypothetical protein [uncultured Gimesia sp.]
MDSHKQCRKCSDTGDDLVMLWDGHVYCPSCLDAAQSGLADYARHHPVLSEELPERIKNKLPTFWTVFSYFIGLGRRWTLITYLVMLILIFSSMSLERAFFLSGFLIAFRIVFTFMGVFFFNRFYTRPQAERVKLSVTEGIVEIRRDDRIVTFPLTSSYWADYSGRITEDLPFALVFLGETFLLVGDRRFRGAMLKSAITMCGFDGESRERWLAFLKLAGVPAQ